MDSLAWMFTCILQDLNDSVLNCFLVNNIQGNVSGL